MTKTELAIKVLREFPNSSTRQIARILYRRFPICFRNEGAARRVVRYAVGASGTADRNKKKKVNMPKRTSLKCPASLAQPWKPVLCGGNNTLIIGDMHLPYHDKKALEIAVDYGKYRGVDSVIIHGDFLDFYNISRFQKRPDQRDTVGEARMGVECLTWLRSIFKKQPIWFKIGNHEQRWDKLIWDKAPELWGFDAVQLHHILKFDDLGIQRVDDQPIKISDLNVFHGHEVFQGGGGAVVPARTLFSKAMANVVAGHVHRTSQHVEPTHLGGTEISCWTIGHLCNPNPEYARINKWNLGFAIVESDNTSFDVSNLRIGKKYKIRAS